MFLYCTESNCATQSFFWAHVNYLGLPNHWQGFWQQKWTFTTNSYYLWHGLLFEYLSIVITLKLWMQAFDSSMHNIEIYCISSKLWLVIFKESLCLSNAVKWISKIILCKFFESTFTSLSLLYEKCFVRHYNFYIGDFIHLIVYAVSISFIVSLLNLTVINILYISKFIPFLLMVMVNWKCG